MKRSRNTTKSKTRQKGVPRALQWRGYFLLGVFLIVSCVGLVARLYNLQITNHERFQVEVAKQQLKDIAITPQRGQIFDANGKVLAKSSIVWNVAADPSQIKAPKLTEEEKKALGGEEPEASRLARRDQYVAEVSQKTAEILNLEYETVYEKLKDPERQYVVLAKQVDKPVADEIKNYASEHNLTISVSPDTKREYPYGAFAASVLGFMHADGYGFYGLEKQYESVLAGTPGRLVSLRNSHGGEVTNDDRKEYQAQDGYSLVSTLVVEIQAIAEKYLENSVKANNVTERGVAIVMDVNTGAILAMASKPDFDPNEPKVIYDPARAALLDGLDGEEYTKVQGEERQRQWKNKAITELYTPGSVFKVITAASALDSGAITTGSSFLCDVGGYQVAGGPKPYRCAMNKAHGIVNINDIIYNSCNQGIIQVAQRMGKDTFSDYYNAFGLTDLTEIDLPAEQRTKKGISYYDPATMSGVDLASSSFGQAMTVTPIQMITAISAAVNGGYLVQPHIVSKIVDKDGNLIKEINPTPKRQVISEEVSAQVRKMLEHVVDYGKPGAAGRNAYVAGYHIGGKSGTTEKLNKPMRADGDYEKVSSFVAVVPVNDPQIAVLAFLDEPHADTDYGSMLSAPLVGNIISEVAPYLGLETDPSLLPSGDVKVPDLIASGHSEWDMAQVELNKLGLTHRRVGNGPQVLAQYPGPGAMVPGGTTVYLYTDSAEIRNVPVPNVVGKSVPLAQQMLAGAGLNAKIEGPEDGVITAQDMTESSQVPMGTLVTLTAEIPAAPEPPPEEPPEPQDPENTEEPE